MIVVDVLDLCHYMGDFLLIVINIKIFKNNITNSTVQKIYINLHSSTLFIVSVGPLTTFTHGWLKQHIEQFFSLPTGFSETFINFTNRI